MSFKRLFYVCLLLGALATAAQAQEAWLWFEVTPIEATLFVDGKPLGDGNRVLRLSPGAHSLDVYNYGYKPFHKDVNMQAGKNAPVVVALELSGNPVSGPWGSVQFEGVPRGTKGGAVLSNGKTNDFFVGHPDEFNQSTPGLTLWKKDELVLPVGTHELTLISQSGSTIWSGNVKVEQNQRTVLDVRNGSSKMENWPDGAKAAALNRFESGVRTQTVIAPVSGTFSATPGKIDCNQPVKLAWSTKETLHAYITSTQGNYDDVPQMEMSPPGTTLIGDKIVSPRATTTYNFRSPGPGGVVTAAAPVEVNPVIKSGITSTMPEILYLKVGDKIMVQDSSTLNWTTYNADTVGLNPVMASETRFTAPKDDLNLSGSHTVTANPRQTSIGPVNEADTYTLGSSNVCGGTDSQATTVTTRGLIESPLASVFFPTAYPMKNKPNIGLVASQKAELNRMAAIFKLYKERNADAKMSLAGHADKRGSVGENQKLAERRVARVKAYLVEQGVPEGSIETIAHGEEERLSPEEVAALEAQNPSGMSESKNKEYVQRAYNRHVDVSIGSMPSTHFYPHKAADAKVMFSYPVVPEATVKKAE